ncbi:MAG TPA: helix-turn-helix transcriptional regulator [Thermoanaerobaculia bacterium]|nr:helix-turn-helix transcriptional regulator [Thermoanaerobaculia bacterium]
MPLFAGLGRALRWLRDRQGKRQYQVAEAAGVTKAMLSSYETGKQKPSLDTLERLLEALDCNLADLHHALEIADESRGAWRSGLEERPFPASAAAARPADSPGVADLARLAGVRGPLGAEEERAFAEMFRGLVRLLRSRHERADREAPVRRH